MSEKCTIKYILVVSSQFKHHPSLLLPTCHQLYCMKIHEYLGTQSDFLNTGWLARGYILTKLHKFIFKLDLEHLSIP